MKTGRKMRIKKIEKQTKTKNSSLFYNTSIILAERASLKQTTSEKKRKSI